VAIVALLAVAGCGSSGAHTSTAARTVSPTPAPSSTTTGSTAPTSSATTGDGAQPTIVGNCGGAAYKPTTLYIICGQARLTATEIKWRSWTAQQAQGSAVMSVITCQPSCSQGPEELLPAELTLTRPMPTSRGPEFTSATIAWSERSPDGKQVETYPLEPG
jgi:hypothetical protein